MMAAICSGSASAKATTVCAISASEASPGLGGSGGWVVGVGWVVWVDVVVGGVVVVVVVGGVVLVVVVAASVVVVVG